MATVGVKVLISFTGLLSTTTVATVDDVHCTKYSLVCLRRTDSSAPITHRDVLHHMCQVNDVIITH